jgi:signal peptide peptidase SppA
MSGAKYAPIGLLALAPRAYGETFATPIALASEEHGAIAVVNVRGPLMHHADPCFDSYDAIRDRVALALASNAKAVVLRIDSPGGLVSGCFDTARDLRRMAETARKPLIAFAENACSAAYALACAAEMIYAAASGVVGSIGVIDTVVDVTALDAQQGVKFGIVTSGARKADSNPHTPLTDAKLAATQASVDTVAGLFFELVSESRQLGTGTVQALEAATFPGVAAKGKQLVDAVTTFESLLADLASGTAATAASEAPVDYEKAVAALRKVAEGEDANAKAAKRALAALDSDDEKKDGEAKAEGDEGEKKPEKKPEEKPEAKAADDEEKKPEAKASAGAQAFDVKTIKAELKAEMRAEAKEAADRESLLATRPDLTPVMRAQLSTLPLATVKAMIAEMPKAVTPAQAAIAGATADVNPTKGSAQAAGDKPQASNLSPYAAQLDAEMGLSNTGKGVRVEGNQLVLSASGAKVK